MSPVAVGTVVQLVTTGLKLSRLSAAGCRRRRRHHGCACRRIARTLSALDESASTSQTRTGLGADLELRHVASPNGTVGILNRIDGKPAPSPYRPTSRVGIPGGGRSRSPSARSISDMSLDSGAGWKLAGLQRGQRRGRAPSSQSAFGAAMFLIFLVLLRAVQQVHQRHRLS